MSNKQPVHRQNHLEFLYDLYSKNVDIGAESVELLRKNGFIAYEKPKLESFDKLPEIADGIFNSVIKTADEQKADSFIDIIQQSETEAFNTVVKEEEYKSQTNVVFEGGREITKADWKPLSVTDHTDSFVEWIDSMNFKGFQNQTLYKPYLLYVQQAEQWMAQAKSPTDFDSLEEREDWEVEELSRCDENSLYFLNRYLLLKEGDMNSGARDYKATKAHTVMLFLLDCGYSLYIGKPRQIAATSTMGGYAVKKILFNPNFFLKFLTQDKEKGEEIFEDKIKYSYSSLPDWMKEEVKNDRDNLFQLGFKTSKGDRKGVNSKIQVVAPSKTAISGGSPQLSFVDEAGNIPILTQIIEDANPTMYAHNPTTGKIEMKRQMVVWGTGGDMEKGGKAFEREFMSAIKRWRDRNFSSGIVPIFFDWTTRPGITKEFYDQKKIEFYSKVGPDAEASKVSFHQQYPATIEEMFLTSSKTLVSQEYINNALDRISKYVNQINPDARPQYGFFEPIYGDKVASENSDLPYNVIGVNWVPTSDIDARATTIIFQHPKQNYKNRYYQGTDPIASDNGQSKMSSAVWDAHYNTISAIVNFRSPNYKEVYLQCALLGMYYDVEKQKGIKEVLETNIGLAYREYKDSRGWFDTLVFDSELPDAFRTQSGNKVGLDNRGHRNKLIIDKMFELIQAFGHKIYMEDFFIQLKTFVCEVNAKGNESWGPMDRRYYFDDILFAVVFAYICRQSYLHLIPERTDEENKKVVIKYETVYDSNNNLTRRPVRRSVRG